MAQISISEASQLWKVSRSTIYRRIVSGILSVKQSESGVKKVETSEMVRVFGEPNNQVIHHETKNIFSVKQVEKVSFQAEIDGLKKEISSLKRENDSLRQQIDELIKDKQWFQDQLGRPVWRKLLPWFGKE